MSKDDPGQVLTSLPIGELADVVAERIAGKVGRAVEDGVRRAMLPEYMDTEQAISETGLSERQLRHLRTSGRVSYRKIEGIRGVLYRTRELFLEIERGKISAQTNPITPSSTNGVSP